MGLQHGHMAEKRLIVKVLGLLGTLADAGLALDAGPLQRLAFVLGFAFRNFTGCPSVPLGT